MARKATAENAEKPAPGSNVDYAKALKILEKIDSLKGDLRETQGELSGVWEGIEKDCGVNKAAAKVFLDKIHKPAEDRRNDFLRSLLGLLKASGIQLGADLVDAAQGKANVVPLPGLGGKPAE